MWKILFCVAVLAVLGVSAVAAEVPKPIPLQTFVDTGGETFFAACLRAKAAPQKGPRDIVFLFDTSAGHAGKLRAQALSVLQESLSYLAPGDRAKLISVDLQPISLTDGFVSPTGEEMHDALAKLRRRVPLGRLDVRRALTAAADSYTATDSDPKHARAVVYIGDGTRRVCLLGTSHFEKLTTRLADERIPLTLCPVGKHDRQLVDALALYTGGSVVRTSETAGRDIAAALTGTVVWPPKQVEWPNGFDAYPRRLPPLRTDRDTIVIGTIKDSMPGHLVMTAAAPGRSHRLAWRLEPSETDDGNRYLTELVAQAKIDRGASLSLLGAGSLTNARTAFTIGVRNAADRAREAFLAGKNDSASEHLAEALRSDPTDPEALALRRVLGLEGVEAERVDVSFPPVHTFPQGDAFPSDYGHPLLRGDGTLTSDYDQKRRAAEQALRTEIQNAVNRARVRMQEDPAGAKQDLLLILESLRKSSDIRPAAKGQLIRAIEGSVRKARWREVELEHLEALRVRNIAQLHQDLRGPTRRPGMIY